MELTLRKPWGLTLFQIIGGSVLLALSAYIAIPLPFTPIPITLQSSVVIFLGIALGPYKGTLSVALYLLEGALGLPVFAGGGATILWLVGPTGGYLIGFLPAAYIAGLVRGQSRMRLFAAFGLGYLVIYLMGVPHLAQFVGWNYALAAGFYPFLIGDAFKAIVGSVYAKEALINSRY